MLALGQDLYNLTTRDLETLLCEPFFRTNTGTIGAGVSGLDLFFNVPRDRCLYLHTVSWEVDPGVAQTTNQIQLHISNPDASARQVWWNLRGVLSGDYNPVANPGVMVGFNLKPGILLPPGAVLGTTVVKSNAANAGGYNIRVGGYLIPPGRIGRVF